MSLSQARTRTRTTRSGNERTNHVATEHFILFVGRFTFLPPPPPPPAGYYNTRLKSHYDIMTWSYNLFVSLCVGSTNFSNLSQLPRKGCREKTNDRNLNLSLKVSFVYSILLLLLFVEQKTWQVLKRANPVLRFLSISQRDKLKCHEQNNWHQNLFTL